MKGVLVNGILRGPFTAVLENEIELLCLVDMRVDTILPFDVIGEEYEILDDPEFPTASVPFDQGAADIINRRSYKKRLQGKAARLEKQGRTFKAAQLLIKASEV